MNTSERKQRIKQLRRLILMAGHNANAGNNKHAGEIMSEVRKLGMKWDIKPNEIGGGSNWTEW